jgi:hypothetical protein
MTDRKNAYRILVGKSEAKRPLGKSIIDERIILRWILKEYGLMVCSGFICIRIGSSGTLFRAWSRT